MTRQNKLIAGMVVGAGAMYLLDPDRGARRRSLLWDQSAHARHKLSDGLAATAREARSRTAGAAKELRSRFRTDVGDESDQRAERLQDNWPPATRLLVGTVGGILAFRGARAKGPGARALSLMGLGLLARAATNLPPRQLVGLGTGRRAIEVQKKIRVAAPVEQVWELWSDFENFPRFMSHLREVRKIDEGRSHWVAVGPAGIAVEWDAIVTDWVPNLLVAWKSAEGSTVETAGSVRFQPTAEGETEIDVQMSYNPPAGALGHAVATFFGADPNRAMDEDILRLKSLLEEGKTRADGEKKPATKRQRTRK